MKHAYVFVMLASAAAGFNSICWAAPDGHPESANRISEERSRRIVINRVPLTAREIARLEQTYGVRLHEGAYWYDKRSGAWGIEGGPTLGIGAAGLAIGGPLRADASNGRTNVFINGRELHQADVDGLRQLGPVLPGRYWVDERGNCGFEGGPAFVNLVQLARSRGQAGCGYSKGRTSYTCDGSGNSSIFFTDAVGNSYGWGK
jgi:hypothetical protein